MQKITKSLLRKEINISKINIERQKRMAKKKKILKFWKHVLQPIRLQDEDTISKTDFRTSYLKSIWLQNVVLNIGDLNWISLDYISPLKIHPI